MIVAHAWDRHSIRSVDANPKLQRDLMSHVWAKHKQKSKLNT